MSGFDKARIQPLHDLMDGHAERGDTGGVAWLAARDTDRAVGAAGPGVPGPSPDGSQGWGFGVGVTVRRTVPTGPAGSYGWAGGLGTSWANDPAERLVGIVLTTDVFTSAFPPPAVIQDFSTGVYAALGD
jgi:CubicO group peptidase (beta-lactamase class C family)